MSTEDYEKGLRKLLSQIHPNIKIGKDALHLVAELCSVFNSRLVEETRMNFKNLRKKEKKKRKKEEDVMTPQHAQNAVKKLLKSRLRNYAMSEGQKSVFRYCNRLLHYDEKKAVELAQKHHHIEVLGSEFNKGLNQVIKRLHEKIKFTPNAKTLIANTLHEVCLKLTEGAVEAARGKQVLTEEDMMASVHAAFGQEMLKHAHGNGSKFVFFFSEGLLDFKVKKHKNDALEEDDPKRRRMHEMKAVVEDWKHGPSVFARGIRTLVRDSHVNVNLTAKAISKLDSVLTNIAPRLAMAAIKLVMNQNATELEPLQLKTAINEIFPPNLANQALSEGGKVWTIMNRGLIHFHPKREVEKPLLLEDDVIGARGKRKAEESELPHKQKKAKVETPLSFTRALQGLIKEVHESSSLSKSGAELLNEALLDLLRKMCRTGVTLASQKSEKQLTSHEIQETVRQLFGGDLQVHAVCAGNQAVVARSTSGFQIEKETVPEIRLLHEIQMSAIPPWEDELEEQQQRKASWMGTSTPLIERREPAVVEAVVQPWAVNTRTVPQTGGARMVQQEGGAGMEQEAADVQPVPPAAADSHAAPQEVSTEVIPEVETNQATESTAGQERAKQGNESESS